MKNHHHRLATALLTMTLGSASLVTAADSGKHPGYLAARSDLRQAQVLLRVHETPDIERYVKAADQKVELAIAEIDHAAVVDPKDRDDHPNVDANTERKGRFEKVIALLRQAKYDMGKEEDNPAAKGMKQVAFTNIEAALHEVEQASKQVKADHLSDNR